MSVASQAIAARRKARKDVRYIKGKMKDPIALARRQAMLMQKMRLMQNRKADKKK